MARTGFGGDADDFARVEPGLIGAVDQMASQLQMRRSENLPKRDCSGVTSAEMAHTKLVLHERPPCLRRPRIPNANQVCHRLNSSQRVCRHSRSEHLAQELSPCASRADE